MLEASNVIVDNVELQDCNKGIAAVIYAPLALSNVAEDKIMTVKNTVIAAVTNSATASNLENCNGFSPNLPGWLEFYNQHTGESQFSSQDKFLWGRTTYDHDFGITSLGNQVRGRTN